MDEQNRQAANTPIKPLGVVAVVSGDGLTDIFTSLGVDLVIEGGQTMNQHRIWCERWIVCRRRRF